MKKLLNFVVGFVVLTAVTLSPVLAADTDSLKPLVKDEARIVKELSADRHLDAAAAYHLSTTKKVPIVDVRTAQEYQFVGHVADSYNVPVSIWGKWDEQKKTFGMEPNTDFIKQFSDAFPDKNAPYIIMCRSGHRSGKAIKALQQAGYTNLYQMWEGFEGIAVSDKTSPNFGKKMVDGWKNKNLPWTYDIDGRLIASK